MRDFPIAAITRFFLCSSLRFSTFVPIPLFFSSLRYALDHLYAQLWLNATRLRVAPPWSLPARVQALRSVAIDGTTCMPREKKVEMEKANKTIGWKNSLLFESNLSRHPPLRGLCPWSPLGNDGYLAALRSTCSRHCFAG